MAETFDAIVIGAGHNGLICGGYLAKAGLRTIVLEKADVLGGCSITEPAIPSCPEFKLTVGGIDHIHILGTPCIKDLALENFGLKYLYHDPLWFFPFEGGKALTVYRDVDKTCSEIAEKFSKRDAKAYRAFFEFWAAAVQAIGPTELSEPTGLTQIADVLETLGMAELLQTLLMSPKSIAQQWFESPEIQAVIAWFGVQAGTAPSSPGSTLASGLLPITHQTGMARPEGGSGKLPESVANMIRAHGGEVVTNSEVRKIVVADGRANGVETSDGRTFEARRAVVSAIDAKRVFTRLVDAPNLNPEFLRRVKNIRTGDISLVNTVYALRERPKFERYGDNIGIACSTQMICPSLEYLDRAWSDILAGEPSRKPALWCAIPSSLDPTLAPPGMHTLWLSEFTTASPRSNTWDELRDETGLKQLDTFAKYSPNTKAAVMGSTTVTPFDREMRTGNIGGNPYQIDMTIDQMLNFRPTMDLSDYRTPIKGLYLTGSGTHPGGGITGAPGHNTAMAVLSDLGINRGKRKSGVRKLGFAASTYRSMKRAREALKLLNSIS